MANQVGRIGGGVLKDNLNLREDNGGKDFLNFKNRSSDTALLHIDAVNNRIGVNDEAPTRDLLVPTKIKSVGGNADTLELPNYTIAGNTLTNTAASSIFLNAAENIQLSALATDQILIDDDRITTTESNANIDLDPSGTGTVEIFNQLKVYGNITTPGNITLGGNLIFGDGPATPDTVSFNTDIDSNLYLDQNNTFNLGNSSKRWNEIYTDLVNGEAIETGSLSVGADDINLKVGNIFYVSVNGDDTNVGDHQQGPFKTVKRALQAADGSLGGPVTIFIFPGDYEEEFPLTVPSNTTVTGHNIRTVTIRPDTSSQSEDAFLLNGESTVENLTIKDFYYDSLNDTGYAFRFAPNAVVSSRSPYIRNISVITQGTTITADDPRGFASGDAGKGALIDGASVDPASVNASMLFHSVTFITPGVDAITMTNGVRVEWLNSFTYFAARGLYAVRGVTGHLSTDGSTVEYGAEIRSIGSANVYGNFGAVADGLGTIMYLIQHNFAYIGAGKHVDNDQTRVLHDQEAVQSNGGKVYYQSTDEQGTFSVGDAFFVDLESGLTSIDATQVDFDGLSQITISDGDNETIIGVQGFDTGNIRFSGNTAFSLDGDLNLTSATGTTNIDTDVRITKDLSITNNLTIDGALITFGNDPNDAVDFNAPLDQDLVTTTTQRFNLGSFDRRWNNVLVDDAHIDSINIKDNFITTNTSNANLEFLSNGAGTVNLENITFNTDTISTVDSDLDLSTPGNLRINADSFVLPKGNNSQRLDGAGDLRFSTVDNIFEGYALDVVGFGGIFSSDRKTAITAHPTNNTISIKVNNVSVGTVNSAFNIHGLESDSLFFNNQTISTIDSNADLEIVRNGTGKVYLNEQEYFRNSTWTNADTNGPLTIVSNDDGYVKLSGTYGFVINAGEIIAEDTSLISTGVALTGATLIDSLSGGVQVVDAGSGAGSSGGFDTYRHYKFVDANTRAVITKSYDFTNYLGGKFKGQVICGNNFNGGEVPDGSENLELQWDDGTNNWEKIGDVALAANFAVLSVWTDFEISFPDTLPVGFDPTTIRFRIVQLSASEPTGDNYGLANLELRYINENSSNPEVGATRYNVGTDSLEVYDGSDWIASTGIEEDPVDEAYMIERTEIWSLILG